MMTQSPDIFASLTEAESHILLRKLREGYATSREATKGLRDYMRQNPGIYGGRVRMLVSAKPGSLAGVRTDLTQACHDLVNHLRILEMS